MRLRLRSVSGWQPLSTPTDRCESIRKKKLLLELMCDLTRGRTWNLLMSIHRIVVKRLAIGPLGQLMKISENK
jgi:hypothetical protein